MRAWLGEALDAPTVDRVRRVLGVVFALAALRPLAYGWVERLYLAPTYHFAWIESLPRPPDAAVYPLFVLQVAAGLGLAIGRHPRMWSALYLLAFSIIESIDVTLYLNHYVLLTLLAAAFAVIPGGERPPRWGLLWLQLLVASVWIWAGLCKLDADWLLRGEPLRTWLRAYADLPAIGPLLAHPATAIGMAWGGAAYDLGIPLLLRARATARPALVLVVLFHVAVWLLFPIGVFPWIMIPAAWLLTVDPLAPGRPAPPVSSPGLALFVGTAAALWLVPARFLLEGGDVRWHERGFRFAWRVMLIEKTGVVDYRVVDRSSGRTWRLRPRDELAEWQHEQMRTQPDLIAQYARHLAQRFAADGYDVAVYADATASLHGRPAAPLVDPTVDLADPANDPGHEAAYRLLLRVIDAGTAGPRAR